MMELLLLRFYQCIIFNVWKKPRGAQIESPADRSDIVGGNDHRRGFRISCAQVKQAEDSADPGHRQVEHDQVAIAILVEQVRELVERSRFVDGGWSENAGNRMTQRSANSGWSSATTN